MLLPILLEYDYITDEGLSTSKLFDTYSRHKLTVIHNKMPEVEDLFYLESTLRRSLLPLSRSVESASSWKWIDEVVSKYKRVRLSKLKIRFLYINGTRYNFSDVKTQESEIHFTGVVSPPETQFENIGEVLIFINGGMYNVARLEIHRNEVLFIWTH